jgi:diguanylate cyclase (GGDEF)-like protein
MLRREHQCPWRQRVEGLERELARLRREAALDDPDTGLGNFVQLNRDFTKLVGRCRRYHEPFSLVLLRITDYRTEAAQLTQASIVRLARVLMETVRVEDYVSRVSDCEFVVLLPRTELEGASALLARLRINISREPLPTEEGTRFLQSVGGCAQWGEHPGGLHGLLDAADTESLEEERLIGRAADEFRSNMDAAS